jgi:hypothetical protein
MTPQSPKEPETGHVPDAAQVHEQLEKMLSNKIFSRAKRISRFLRFIVEETLAGRKDDLKEEVLARELRNIKDVNKEFHPGIRVDARRLRGALLQYYSQSPGDEVIILVPVGGYKPAFSFNPDVAPTMPVIPGGSASADIVGTWISDDFKFKGDVIKATFEFKRHGPVIAGSLHHTVSEKNALNIRGGITDVKVDADNIDFTIKMDVFGMHPSKQFPLRCAGVLSGDRLSLAALWDDGPTEFTAKRVIAPL